MAENIKNKEMDLRRTLLITVGFLGGLFFGAALITKLQAPVTPGGEDLLAEIGNEQLTRAELEKQLTVELVPIQNDEYRILERGVEEWLHGRLFQKEAQAQGVTVEELYRKEIWSRVRVSYNDIVGYYNKNKELYNLSLEQANPFIHQDLRRIEYLRVKEEYLNGLRQKYGAKSRLKKPKSFVEGLALPYPSPSPALPKEAGPAAPAVIVPPAPTAPPSPPPSPVKSPHIAPPSRGPQNAPVTVTEFADFHCHFCKKVSPALEELMKNYSGKIKRVFRHYPLSTTPGQGSFLTHEAAACAHEQKKFWEFHDKIFALDQGPQASELENLAQAVGLNMNKFQECLKTGKYRETIQKDLNEGNQKGVQGTPTIFVNDQIVPGAYPYEHFANLVEGILNPGKKPPVPPAPQPSPPPPPAPAPVVPSAPAPIQFNDLEGRPALGPKNAPVTLVEFSDFHCPFCKRVGPALEELMKNYSGKVRRVWRHYPLAMHAGADRTHEASECANEQEKFWVYHDKLFETQGAPRDDAALLRIAQEAGLDQKKFEKCLTDGKYKDLIKKEVEKGNQVGVRGTPTVFVNGQLISGAQPYQNFELAVKNELAKKS